MTRDASSAIIRAQDAELSAQQRIKEFSMFNAFATNNPAPVAIMVPAVARAYVEGLGG